MYLFFWLESGFKVPVYLTHLLIYLPENIQWESKHCLNPMNYRYVYRRP